MRILIVDDEARFAGMLRRSLEGDGHDQIAIASSGEEALESLRGTPAGLVVTDLRMRGMNGLDLLAAIKHSAPSTQVVLMTAFADVATARQALTRGALDYLIKPFDLTELSHLVDRARARHAEDDSAEDAAPFAGMIGVSATMRRLFGQLGRVAESDASVLITGESGTGKELVARALHDLSPRHRSPFVDVNAAAISESLVESELFGHEQGAFTGADRRHCGKIEAAAGGTLFLDEIGELSLTLQPKLLRFLQERRFNRVGGTTTVAADVRVVAATNRDLRAEAAAGRFRQDLLYRLEGITLRLPPLRERKEDIPALVRHLLRRRGFPITTLSPSVFEALSSAAWPGNIRQLINVVDRALILGGGVVDVDGLDLEPMPSETQDESAPLRLGLEDSERNLISRALADAGGNKTVAADRLGITRRRLYSRLKSLGMDET